METGFIKSAIESIFFISDKPVTIAHLKRVFENISDDRLTSIISELQNEYDASNRGIRIQNLAGGYSMTSDPSCFKYVRKFLSEKRRISLSLPALECLALIAYKQPVTVPEINDVRGIDSGAVVKNLLSKDLIKVLGKKDSPGRPYLYGTTKEFLIHFGMKDLESLPSLEDIKHILE